MRWYPFFCSSTDVRVAGIDHGEIFELGESFGHKLYGTISTYGRGCNILCTWSVPLKSGVEVDYRRTILQDTYIYQTTCASTSFVPWVVGDFSAIDYNRSFTVGDTGCAIIWDTVFSCYTVDIYCEGHTIVRRSSTRARCGSLYNV